MPGRFFAEIKLKNLKEYLNIENEKDLKSEVIKNYNIKS